MRLLLHVVFIYRKLACADGLAQKACVCVYVCDCLYVCVGNASVCFDALAFR